MENRRSPRAQWKTNTLYSTIAAICANGLLVSQAQAVPSCGSPTVSTSQNSQCSPYYAEDVTVASGVTISTTDMPAVWYDSLGKYDQGGNIGSLTNNGNILSSGSGEDFFSSSSIAGVAINGALLGTLTNNGVISANAEGENSKAFGIYTNDLYGSINNHGTISGTATKGEGYSIYNEGTESGISSINNHQSGVLRGRLYVGGYNQSVVNNDGLIDLPMGRQAGYVAGDFNQSATGTLRITAAGDGEDQYSQLQVSKHANIAGKAFVDVQKTNTLAVGQTLDNVVYTQNGSLSGNFAQVNDNSALFNFQSLSTTGEDGHIDFKIVKGMTGVDAVNANNNPSALGAAGALDRIIDRGATTPNMQSVIDALGKLGTEQEVSNAISQTTPLLVGNSAIAANAALTGISRVIQSRIESHRGMSSGDELYGNHKVWLKTFGSRADQNDRNGTSGFEANTAGLALGADSAVSDVTRVGLAFSYANADIDGNSHTAPNSAEVDLFQVLGYGSHNLDTNTELNFQAGVGMNNTEGKRDILFLGETARSDYDSLVATTGVGLARSYTLNDSTNLTPSVRTDYIWIQDESYTEKGSSANLKVDSRTTDQLLLSMDGKLSHEFKPDMIVSANFGVGYDALNSQSSITASFAGEPDSGFTTEGLEPSPWLQRAGLSLVSNTENGMEISLHYDAEHRESFLNQTASLKLSKAF